MEIVICLIILLVIAHTQIWNTPTLLHLDGSRLHYYHCDPNVSTQSPNPLPCPQTRSNGPPTRQAAEGDVKKAVELVTDPTSKVCDWVVPRVCNGTLCQRFIPNHPQMRTV